MRRLFPFLSPSGRDALPRPSQCAACHGWGSGRVCGDCIARYASPVARCRRCATLVPPAVDTCGACLREPPPFDAALAAVDYAYPWDALVTHFKFHAALDLAAALAGLVVAAWQRGGAAHPGLLLPVPLADARLRERGYNQAWELARRCARSVAAPSDATLLLRLKDTPHQVALAPGRRAANVRGVFAVEPLRSAELRGRSVTLVDDVMTTGATLAEAARVLRQAGAASVQVWVVARTPAPAADTD